MSLVALILFILVIGAWVSSAGMMLGALPNLLGFTKHVINTAPLILNPTAIPFPVH